MGAPIYFPELLLLQGRSRLAESMRGLLLSRAVAGLRSDSGQFLSVSDNRDNKVVRKIQSQKHTHVLQICVRCENCVTICIST